MLPYSTPLSPDPKKRRQVKLLRILAYAALAAVLLIPTIQLQYKILRNQKRMARYQDRLAAGTLTDAQRAGGPPKEHKGAINRWRSQIRALWAGENIYVTEKQYVAENAARQADRKRTDLGIRHPNAPCTVVLLSPFAYLPVSISGLAFTLLKVVVLVLAGLAAVRVVNHETLRMPDWVVALGVVWWMGLAISDIQHANTNSFVLGAIVLHLWFYRRGNDLRAGAALALAIVLKMTPALFVLYWAYQRNWRLLLGCLIGGVLLAVVLPAGLLGPDSYAELTQTWLDNLIFQGLGGAWYPIHVNQSLPAVIGRYLLAGRAGGDLNWNPDDYPYEAVPTVSRHAWIALCSLPEPIVRRIIQAVQAGVVLLMAWGIGWRKRPRDDGRRGLHYAMVLAAMLLLNQRTWDHHAAILFPAFLAVWYAVAFGRMVRPVRITALTMLLLAGALLWGAAGDLAPFLARWAGQSKEQAKNLANLLQAYGPKGAAFLLTFLVAVMLSVVSLVLFVATGVT